MVHVFGVQPFVASLAAMFLARGLCYVLAPESVPIRDESFVALSDWSVQFGDGWRVT
jgi:simple sugar transport system permease protein